MAHTETDDERLTLWDAIRDLSWFSRLCILFVGAPSLLQIGQYAFPHFRLTPFFQWIPDGWRQLTDFMGGVLEPWVMPAINRLSDVLHLDLNIDPSWRSLFALMTVIWASQLRTSLRRDALWRKQGASSAKVGWIAHALQVPGVAFGALAAGAAISAGGWLGQGLAAALPILFFQCFTAFGHAIEAIVFALMRSPNVREAMRQATAPLLIGAPLGGVGFSLGACLSLVPGLNSVGGVLALAGVVGIWGLILTSLGLSRIAGDRIQNLVTARSGLTMLGGFVAAGIVAATDAAVRLTGGA